MVSHFSLDDWYSDLILKSNINYLKLFTFFQFFNHESFEHFYHMVFCKFIYLKCVCLFLLFQNATVFVNTAVPTEIKCVVNQPCEFPIPISGQNLSRYDQIWNGILCYFSMVFYDYFTNRSYQHSELLFQVCIENFACVDILIKYVKHMYTFSFKQICIIWR